MRHGLKHAVIPVLVLVSTLSGCGDDGGNSATAVTGITKGTITAKGSVFVNGIEFNTSTASIKVDDNPGFENDLQVGMVVKIRGTSDNLYKTGKSSQIDARDRLEGPIEAVDAPNRTLTVMGQTVRIEDNVTRLNDDSNQKLFADAGFQVGDSVEVHGFPDDNGGLRATRVAKKVSGTFTIKGFVTSLGATSFGLSLTPGASANLTVNFSPYLFPAGVSNGSFVEVRSQAAPLAGVLTASQIKPEEALGGGGERVEVEGIVTSGTVAGFVVDGQSVITHVATLYEAGLKSDLDVGTRVEVEGTLNGSGEIVAGKITFRSTIKLEADAAAVSSTGLTVLGKAVAIVPTTRIDNGPIGNGSHVEVRAFADRNGNLVASRIVVGSADSRAFLQGPVTAYSATEGSLTILGTSIVAGPDTEWRISTDAADLPVIPAAFFARLSANETVVKVRWDNFSAPTELIKQAEIQLGK